MIHDPADPAAIVRGPRCTQQCGVGATLTKDFTYPYFELLLPYFYKRAHQDRLDGLKVWPEGSELIEFARIGWTEYQKQKAPRCGGA